MYFQVLAVLIVTRLDLLTQQMKSLALYDYTPGESYISKYIKDTNLVAIN